MKIFYFFVLLTINLVSSQLTLISRQKNDNRRTTVHQYDKVGNITRLVNSSSVGSDTQTFTYDHLNRLSTATAGGGLANYDHSDPDNDYNYDLIGNITYLGNNTPYDYQNWSATCPQPIPTQAMPHAVRKIGNQYFCYDRNGNMTIRYDGLAFYTQTFNLENELTSVVVNGQTTSFSYDANGMRVKTVRPNGTIIDTPFPDYEVESPGQASQTIRITLSIAGQAVAQRVITTGGSTYYYLFTDHLGSLAAMQASDGSLVGGSRAYYYPFGDYRGTPPSQTLTDRGFTGQRSNNQPAADLGLLYYNARYYVPTIGKFASADTIVPDPAGPQQFNRYAYTLNNPVRFTDPSGHSCGNPSNAWPEHYVCNKAEQQILAATIRIKQTRFGRGRWSQGYVINGEIGTSHATIINNRQAITHNHFEGRDNSAWQITNADGQSPIPPSASPGLNIAWHEFDDANQTLLADFGFDILQFLNEGKAKPVIPIYQSDWSNLIGQEVGLISFDGQNTFVVWDIVTGIKIENGSKFALLSTHVGQVGQSGGGAFIVSGGQVYHIGNILGADQSFTVYQDERRYLPRPNYTSIALNSLNYGH